MITKFDKYIINEGFLKRFLRRKDPFYEYLAKMREQQEEMKELIKKLEKSEEEIKLAMFNKMSKKERERLLRRKEELENRLKEMDPYGEEEWSDELDLYGDDDYFNLKTKMGALKSNVEDDAIRKQNDIEIYKDHIRMMELTRKRLKKYLI